jgi:O-glycosyl hydrolase
MLRYRFFFYLLGFSIILFSLSPPSTAVSATDAIININPSKTFQSISGWEATSQSGQLVCAGFDQYKNKLFHEAVNDLGINRLRLEIKSGAENPVDHFAQFMNGQITLNEWKAHWYEIINDNSEKTAINSSGFHFSELDHDIERVVQPMRDRVQANGEKLFVNLNYVDFGSSAFEHKTNPEEYAEFVLATYQHIQNKYGWVPDAWEVILEPDTGAAWSATQIGNAIAAAAARLKQHGFTPKFIAPSATNMGNSVSMFDQLIQIPGVLPYVSELAYHRYSGISDANLQAIANRAVQYGINSSMLEHVGSGYQDLHNDLKLGRTSAWQQFTLGFCTNDNGAQYYWIDVSNPNNPSVNRGSKTRYLRQYFKFIRSGAVRIEATGDNANFDPLAFINSDGKYVVVVKANQGGSITIQGLPAGEYGIKYTTNSQYDINLSNQTIQNGQSINTSIPATGVITIYDYSGSYPTTTIPIPANQTVRGYLPLISLQNREN